MSCIFAAFLLHACKKVDNIVVTNTNIVTDIDGNKYHIITIGKQQWLQENLQTTYYQDTTPIPNFPQPNPMGFRYQWGLVQLWQQ